MLPLIASFGTGAVHANATLAYGQNIILNVTVYGNYSNTYLHVHVVSPSGRTFDWDYFLGDVVGKKSETIRLPVKADELGRWEIDVNAYVKKLFFSQSVGEWTIFGLPPAYGNGYILVVNQFKTSDSTHWSDNPPKVLLPNETLYVSFLVVSKVGSADNPSSWGIPVGGVWVSATLDGASGGAFSSDFRVSVIALKPKVFDGQLHELRIWIPSDPKASVTTKIRLGEPPKLKVEITDVREEVALACMSSLVAVLWKLFGG